MKRKRLILCLLAAVFLCLCLAIPGAAAERYVYDTAGLLTASEASALEQKAADISSQYGCAVYIVTVNNYKDYTDGSVVKAAKAIYTDNGFGWGEEKSGVMLLLSMRERDFALIAYGYGNTAFTDYGKERLQEEFLDNFKRDDWSGGLSDYVSFSGKMLQRARDGRPIDRSSDGLHSFARELREALGASGVLLVIVGVPCAIAWFVCNRAKENMKNVKKASEAEFFAVPESFELYQSTENFSHITETRVRIESDSDRGGDSGGGTSVDSDGFSSSSGKF